MPGRQGTDTGLMDGGTGQKVPLASVLTVPGEGDGV